MLQITWKHEAWLSYPHSYLSGTWKLREWKDTVMCLVLCTSERARWQNDSQQNTSRPCFLTYDTERLSGKFEPPSPSSVSTAAASSPYPYNVFHSKHHDGHNFLKEIEMVDMWHGCTVCNECRITADMIPTRMYKALSELFLNSLMVAKTESMRQEKTKRKLEDIGKHTQTVIAYLCYLS